MSSYFRKSFNFFQQPFLTKNLHNYNDRPVSSPETFKILVILDESGSMEPVRQKMIDSINDLIKEQKQVKGKFTTFTLVKFNNKITRVIENKPLENVNLLDKESYCPNAPTALYDAIGDTFRWFRYEKNVLCVIITDGLENASRDYSRNQIMDAIENKKRYDEWSFVYLSNSIETSKQGDVIGLEEGHLCTNKVMRQDFIPSYIGNTLNCAVSNYRKHGTSIQSQLNAN